MFLFLLQSNDPDLPYQDSDVESECNESDDDIESDDDDRFSFTDDSSGNEEEELEGPFQKNITQKVLKVTTMKVAAAIGRRLSILI